MTMVVSRRQRIFFRYEGERGAFLVLHHGLLGSHEDWYAAGYVEELAKEFRVVIPDARGHGRSDKPAEPEQYSQLQMAEDLIEILNELGIRNSHFVGYGIGALVGFELLRRFPERVRIAILGGESALMTPAVQEVYRAEAESLKAMSLADYLKALKDQNRVVRHAAAVDEEQERPAALALMAAAAAWEPAPAERIQVTSPLTLFAGSEDPAAGRVEAARSGVSRARLVPFAGFSHTRLFQERTQLMEEILRLLKSGRRDEEGRPRGEHGQPGAESGRGLPSGAAGQGGPGPGADRRRSPPGRDSQRYGNRSSDRRTAGGAPGSQAEPGGAAAAQAAPAPPVDGPSPIPGAVLDAHREPGIAPAPGAWQEDAARAPQEPSAPAAGPAAPQHEPEASPAEPGASQQPGPPPGPEPDAGRHATEARDAAEEAGWAAEPPPDEIAERAPGSGEPPKE